MESVISQPVQPCPVDSAVDEIEDGSAIFLNELLTHGRSARSPLLPSFAFSQRRGFPVSGHPVAWLWTRWIGC